MLKKRFVKGMVIFICFFMGISIAGCSHQSVPSKSSQISKQDPKATVSLSDGRIKLYPNTENDGMYTNYILEIDGKQKSFPWRNITNTMFNPRLYLNNIGGETSEELVIITTVGEGTGVHIEDAHVINPKNLDEINIENPLDVIKDRIKTQITKSSTGSIVRLYIDGQEEDIQMANTPDDLFTEVVYKNQIRFQITNNRLVAIIGAQVSAMQFIGNIKITYTYDHTINAYKASKIEFLRN